LQGLTREKDSDVPPSLTRNTFADLIIEPLEDRMHFFPCLSASEHRCTNLKSY